ncbi:MAG: Ldh family oxidoreductase [Armatimonadota bacterium]|nr:Ldh family oxidoreductase [Armatimonadota bacterium]
MSTVHRLSAGHLHFIARRLFEAAGAPQYIADDVAEILVKSNLAGHDSHGVLRAPQYLRRIEEGRITPAAEPVILKETPNILRVDGRDGFGLYTARWAMRRAIAKARQAQVCCVSLTRTGHIGRVGEYAEQAAYAGCIGIITSGDSMPGEEYVVPFGGIKGTLGTNPIAAGVPTGDDAPFVLDYATSVIAEGKIKVAVSKGVDLPEGYILDKHGRPTVRTADFYDGGFLLPFGRHKGYALSVLVTLLGGLTGNFDIGRGTMDGKFMLVLDVAAFTPLEAFQRGVRATLNAIKALPPAEGVDEVLVPGDPEYRSRLQRLAEGIEVPDMVYQQIRDRALALGISMDERAVPEADLARYR